MNGFYSLLIAVSMYSKVPVPSVNWTRAVSYTHLDVYKRQSLEETIEAWSRWKEHQPEDGKQDEKGQANQQEGADT